MLIHHMHKHAHMCSHTPWDAHTHHMHTVYTLITHKRVYSLHACSMTHPCHCMLNHVCTQPDTVLAFMSTHTCTYAHSHTLTTHVYECSTYKQTHEFWLVSSCPHTLTVTCPDPPMVLISFRHLKGLGQGQHPQGLSSYLKERPTEP